MKRFVVLLTFAWMACVQADVYLKSNYYLNCHGCSVEADFINQARLHFENLHPYSDDIPIRGIGEKYIVANLRFASLTLPQIGSTTFGPCCGR